MVGCLKLISEANVLKYLVIGSAPYIQKWYADRGKVYLDAGYKLVAINNAWVIDFGNTHVICIGSDFGETGSFYPTRRIINQFRDKFPEKVLKDFPDIYKYEKDNGSGTMILNVLTILLNNAVKVGKHLEVCIAGCDLIYKGECNHFYGSGTVDPLRYGEAWLLRELNRVKGFYEKEGFEIYNAGNQEETLLPFARKRL